LYNEKNYATKAIENTIALIHRLQDEKQKVVQDYYCEAQHCDVQKDIIEKQKAEIERLKDEKYKVEQNLKQCENGYELELHTARFDMRMNRERNAELQKQVDELTIVNANLIKRINRTVQDTAKEIANWLVTTESDKEDLAKIIKEHYGVEVE
jgi:hypothetical protein